LTIYLLRLVDRFNRQSAYLWAQTVLFSATSFLYLYEADVIQGFLKKPDAPRSLFSLTWIKAAFNNNATALWRPSWWESATAGHKFGRGPSNAYSISLVLTELLVPDKMFFM
jgi:hypothetical protein